MTGEPQHDTLTVLVLDTRPEAAALVAMLETAGFDVLLGVPADLDVVSVDVVVAHPSTPGWPRLVARARRDHPGRRLLALVDDLGRACEAVNELGVDGLACEPRQLLALLAEFVQPPADLETRVQQRTSALQLIKAQWEQTFDAVRDPLVVLDDHYRVIRANRAYAQLLSVELVDLPGRCCYLLRQATPAAFADVDEDARCRECPVPQVRQQGEPAAATLRDVRGHRWLVSAYPVRLAGQPTSLVVHYRDVSDVHERQDRLVRESKLAAVGDLAGAIAHELNSPMTSIMVFSEALARKTAEGSELNDNALEINEAARRCQRLIRGLLRFARRPRSVEMGAVSLVQILDELRPLLEHRLAVAGVTLESQLDLDVARVWAHVADLEHVLVELLVNALEACRKDDRIVVRARELPDERLELVIEDTGAGMNAEVLASALDPFFTTKSEGRGTGLGLTTCEALVAQMGGRLQLGSTLGVGTTVTLWLRVARA